MFGSLRFSPGHSQTSAQSAQGAQFDLKGKVKTLTGKNVQKK